MEIKIELPDWKCEHILLKHGYDIEEVTAYYESNSDHYNKTNGDTLTRWMPLYPIKIKIAYQRHAKPEELKKEYPMLYVLQDFACDKVVNRLFNSDLWDLMMCNG